MYITIKTLWEKGISKSEISRLTGHDWKTVAKVIKNIQKGIEIPLKYSDRESILDPYKEKILKLLEIDLSGVRIHEELVKDGFKGTYSAVKKYIRKLKRKTNIFVRINTEPAEESQVDFGYVGLTVKTFIAAHINVFEEFGGITKTVKIGNLKSAILVASFYEPLYQ